MRLRPKAYLVIRLATVGFRLARNFRLVAIDMKDLRSSFWRVTYLGCTDQGTAQWRFSQQPTIR
jgi:hypothetical protein